MVVCGPVGHLVESEEGREAQEEFDPGHGDFDYGVGHERASAGPDAEHACAYGVWVYADGGGGGEDHRDSVRVAGSGQCG